jgi:hypothetical protein
VGFIKKKPSVFVVTPEVIRKRYRKETDVKLERAKSKGIRTCLGISLRSRFPLK